MTQKTIRETAVDMYQKKYNVTFISEFLGADVPTIKSWVLKDDPKKQFKKIDDVPDSYQEREANVYVPTIKKQMAEDMPTVIKGLTLVGYSLAEMADTMGVSEESILDMITSVEDVADAYNEAKRKINVKVAETLLATILPKILKEKTYKMTKDATGQDIKVLVKEVIKEVGGNVEGLFKWLELNAPEKWSVKNKSLSEFLKESGIALVPADVEEAKWEEMAVEQQSTLSGMLQQEKDKIDAEYSDESPT